MLRKRGVQTDKTPSEDRSVGSALKGIEARRHAWPGRRLPETEGPPAFWCPGNVVGPQRLGPQRPAGTSSPTPRLTPHTPCRRPEIGFVFRLDSTLVRPKSQCAN